MSYNITRRDFIKQAGTFALAAGAMTLVGCGSTSGGQISGSTGDDGEKIITNEIKTSIGKDTPVDGYSYKIDDVFKNETAEKSIEYGYHVWVSAPSNGGMIYDDHFRLYVDGQKLENLIVDFSRGLGSAPGSGGLLPGSSTRVTVRGTSTIIGSQLKVEIVASDISFRGDGIPGTIRKQTIVSYEATI